MMMFLGICSSSLTSPLPPFKGGFFLLDFSHTENYFQLQQFWEQK
jgi:hypothetical protein